VLAARAAGWLERPAEAARWLKTAGAEGLLDLEPEERPAVLGLAGDLEAARAAAEGELAPLWNAVLRGEVPGRGALARLDGLEPFRRARLLLDLELLLPGVAPAERLAEAAARFRRIGASRYAALLERAEQGGWSALRRYLESSPGGAPDPGGAAELLRAIGHSEAELLLRRRDGSEERRVSGGGGEEELAAEVDGGTLLLRAPRIDDSLRALFALFLRELEVAPRAAGSAAAAESTALLGRSPLLLAALERLLQFAASEMPVLLLGESGTGKELAAREVRRASARAGGPWVAVNCAALSETLLLSDLFGHARGAFTGADRAHAGVFETAHGGTVFLDEIGDLPPVAQGNLLRVLQEGEVRRLGESLPRKVDVRLIAATHRDLATLVREGKFRQDLFYRLKVCTVTLPPLRERGDDLELLAESFLETERRRLGRPLLRFAPEARRRLLAHSWPGNVRELQHAIRAAATLAGDGPIGAEALDIEVSEREPPAAGYHREVEEFRRALVRRALAATQGNRAAAARQLGLSRQALSYLVRELGLDAGR
jgi:two-component system NtrC family response regulator